MVASTMGDDKEGAVAQRGSMTQSWVVFMVEVVSS